MGVTHRSRSAKEACGCSLTWGRQTSSLGNMSESHAGCETPRGWRAQPIQAGIRCNPARGQQAITLNLSEMRSQL